MPKLILVQGNCDRDEIHINERLSIGRGLSNDLKILDHNVSRQHVIIEEQENQFLIKDLSSTNGTLINGLYITEKILSEGDQIQIGKNIFLFEKDSTRIYFPQKKKAGLEIIDVKKQKQMDIAMEVETQQLSLIDDNLLKKHPKELIKAHRKLSIIFEIVNTLGTATQLVPLLSKILESIFKVLPVTQGFVLLADPYTNELIPVIMKKRGKQASDTHKISASNHIIQHVRKSKKGILTALTLDESAAKKRKSTKKKEKSSVMCVPLFIRDQLIGIIWVNSQDEKAAFTSDDLELITAIAQQTSLAIENIRLTQERIKGERLSAIGEMVSSIAHEIKNPLSSIQIYTELLQKLHDDQNQVGYCHVILNEINHLLEITNQILDYGQNISLKLEETNLHDLIDEVLKILEQQTMNKKLSIKRNFHEELTAVSIDRDKMKQVLFNILLNALQMSPEGKEITISTNVSSQKKHYIISIADQGPGIPSEAHDQIFQPFFSNRKGGTGLGLSICQRIVEEHQGRIRIESEGEQHAVFLVELPFIITDVQLPAW